MQTVKQRSKKQEKSVAKTFNARTVVASGALWGSKGDVRNDNFLIECKTTVRDYYSLNAKTWEKIESEAIRDHGRIPLLVIDLKDSERYVVFSHRYFQHFSGYFEMSTTLKDKSYTIRSGYLDSIKDAPYVYGKNFAICGNKKNVLSFMREKDFIDFMLDLATMG